MSNLDAQELFALGLAATNGGNPREALIALKSLIEIEPAHAEAWFLAAANHAQIGMFDRAIEGFSKALEINPALDVARLELALVQIVVGRRDAAVASAQRLEAEARTSALRKFGAALAAALNDDFERGLPLMDEAIVEAGEATPLGQEMRKVLVRLQAEIAQKPQAAEEKKPEENSHLFLSAYSGKLSS